jgi:low affinity Fe/Cu permease
MAVAGIYFPQIGEKINSRLRASVVGGQSDAHISGLQREDKVRFMDRTPTAELRKHEEQRDFFCVVSDAFRVFARKASAVLGSAWAFAVAIVIIVVWALTGPMFHFSDTWQLIINTGTTIVTFLMVFLIQNTQNRDAKAVHLKLDEIIRALSKARNELVDLEALSDEELSRLEDQFKRVRTKAENQGTNMRHVEPEALESDR